jgi:TPR repeat protein
MFFLARMYAAGAGVEKNIDASISLLERAKSRSILAKGMLGRMMIKYGVGYKDKIKGYFITISAMTRICFILLIDGPKSQRLF